jgi:hypothetical protein
LYMVPPMYHLNRATWAARKDRIVRHFMFWSPLHRQLAGAPMTRFEWLSGDRMLQRATFSNGGKEVRITVNFAKEAQDGYPPVSATIDGAIELREKRYVSAMRD